MTVGGDGLRSFTFTRDQLTFFLTHVSEAILGVDANGTIEFASSAIRDLTGFAPESVLGHNVIEYLHPDEHAHIIERIMRWSGRPGATAGPTVRAKHASGEWVEVSIEALSGPDVEPFAIVVTLRPSGEEAEALIELHRRLVNEDRLTRLASTFVNLPPHRLQEGVDAALREMGGLEGVDRACLVIADAKLQQLANTHEWCAPGIASLRADYGVQPWRHDVPLMQALERSETVHLPSIDDLGETWALERRFWQRRSVKSLLAVPLFDGSNFLGFVGFEAVRESRSWDGHHIATLRSAAGIIAQALARWEAERQLAHQARHDSLTGLGNRWYFLERLTEALMQLDRRNDGADIPGVAVAIFDIDRFKVVNDSLGHSAGDTMLVEVARRLDLARRDDMAIARLGGDEVVLLLEGVTDETAAREVAAELQKVFQAPIDTAGHESYVSASVGVAFTDDPDARAEDLLRDADAAMYLAKARGRNRVELFDESLRKQMRERLTRQNELRKAVREGQLRVYYQPEFVLTTGEIVGAEALLRWEHPTRGVVAAADFITMAEETGAILEIGAWVLEQACAQLGEWQRRWPDQPFLMRVNLSARQVAQPDLVPLVVHAVSASGIEPSSLCLEITETTLMSDAEVSLEVLEKLRGLGVELAIDDFGTGYSSLSYLKRFPVNVVKIDRSFVDGLGSDPDDTAIVAAIIRLAESMGMGVTAEGVETDRQAAELVELGCTSAQGYLFAQALPPDEFEALAER